MLYNRDGIVVRDMTREDVDELKDRLRPSDVQECWSSNHHTPEEALWMCYDESIMRYTVTINSVPAMVFGIASPGFISSKASIWLLATPEMKKIQRRFIRHSREFIQFFLSFYPLLFNYVDARNHESIQWLHWCGAEISEPEPRGPENDMFHYFQFRRA